MIRPVCEWFLLCTRRAAGNIAHPVLGFVPVCAVCAGRHNLTFIKEN